MIELSIVILYAGLAGLMLMALTFNLLHQWVRQTRSGLHYGADLRRAERLVSSFVEYVPLTLILMIMLEVKGTPVEVLHGLGAGLLVGRLLHAIGSNRIRGADALRFIGTQLTFLVLMIISLACLYYYAFSRL